MIRSTKLLKSVTVLLLYSFIPAQIAYASVPLPTVSTKLAVVQQIIEVPAIGKLPAYATPAAKPERQTVVFAKPTSVTVVGAFEPVRLVDESGEPVLLAEASVLASEAVGDGEDIAFMMRQKLIRDARLGFARDSKIPSYTPLLAQNREASMRQEAERKAEEARRLREQQRNTTFQRFESRVPEAAPQVDLRAARQKELDRQAEIDRLLTQANAQEAEALRKQREASVILLQDIDWQIAQQSPAPQSAEAAVAQARAPEVRVSESEETRKLRQQLEESKRRDAERAKQRIAEEGKRIQQSVSPSPVPTEPTKPIQGTPAPAVPTVGQAKEYQVQMPPTLCNDVGRLIAAVDQAKQNQVSLGNGAVARFVADINAAQTCDDFRARLGKYINVDSVQPRPVEETPQSRYIITSLRDPYVQDYGIPFNRPFTHWSQQRVARTELRTLEDFRNHRQTLLDHIKYFDVPENHPFLSLVRPEIRARLARKVAQMRAEAPSVLNACLDEPWRWSKEVGLCRWVDAADAPVWVTTWAKQTLWGVYYDLKEKRDAPMLVAYLPNSKEYMFWAGPCGGNGGWLPSAPAGVIRVNVRRLSPQCDRIEALGAQVNERGEVVLPEGRQLTLRARAQIHPAIAEQNLQPNEYRLISDWVWAHNGQTIAESRINLENPAQERIVDQITVNQPGTYSLANRSQDTSVTGQPKVCAITVVRPVPPAKCVSVSVFQEGDQVRVDVQYDDPGRQVSRFEYLVNGRKVGESNVPQFRMANRFGVGRHRVTVILYDKHGRSIDQCPADAGNPFIDNPAPCPTDFRIQPKKVGQNETAVTFNLAPPSGTTWVDYTVTFGNRTYNRTDLSGDLLTIDLGSLGLRPGKYRGFGKGQVRTATGQICPLTFDLNLEVKGPGVGKKILAALLIAGAIVGIVMAVGKGGDKTTCPSGKCGGLPPLPGPGQ